MPHPSQMAHHSSFHQAMFCHHAFLIRFTHTDVRTRWVGMFTHTTGEQTTRSMVGGMVYAYAYMNIQIYTEFIFGKYISYHIWYQISYHIIYIYIIPYHQTDFGSLPLPTTTFFLLMKSTSGTEFLLFQFQLWNLLIRLSQSFFQGLRH